MEGGPSWTRCLRIDWDYCKKKKKKISGLCNLLWLLLTVTNTES